MTKPITQLLHLLPENNDFLAILSGQNDEHFHFIETALNIDIKHRGHEFSITGAEPNVYQAIHLLQQLYQAATTKQSIDQNDIYHQCRTMQQLSSTHQKKELIIKTREAVIKPHTDNQYDYLDQILTNDITFGIGPAGTGKTYLAVACAVDALEREKVRRIILVRPAVEAGERLGFLPGDMAQKVDPYLRPLYDALYEMLGLERVEKLIARHAIEIAPLAFMRGRTLNDAFIILDESQNTTEEQMKMFLTRMGFGSTAVITGDITQIDLAMNKRSGLLEAIRLLKNVEGIRFTFFNSKDVIRHPLVQKIVEAYEANKKTL
ncbi:MAG: hypothetical protein A2X77_06335 [Gammaproteobacteria bacterium GWE2_42_36]|nr:MAG: hypothetical protein A2X77_06335 [Gammaproteobacteria bacterium GWE2_42_36]HCU05276.1 phosphate starvation-inducible protein PhoH [Coxiellaceae bacterium]